MWMYVYIYIYLTSNYNTIVKIGGNPWRHCSVKIPFLAGQSFLVLIHSSIGQSYIAIQYAFLAFFHHLQISVYLWKSDFAAAEGFSLHIRSIIDGWEGGDRFWHYSCIQRFAFFFFFLFWFNCFKCMYLL